MKTNLKSGNAIVRFLLSHGEKIGALAIAVCTGLVIWSAIGQPRLEREPSDLATLATQTRAKVTKATWNDLSLEEKIIAEPVPEAAMAKISPQAYPNYTKSFNPLVADPVTRRTDPVMLAPIDLEVNADSGLWASANPDQIADKQIEMLKEQQRKKDEREAARVQAQRGGGRGQRGGPGGGAYGGGGEGGYGGSAGAGTNRGQKPAKDAPIVQRPRAGAQLQGFEEITAKSWVTVLAKIPIEDQTQLYLDSLRTSLGYKEKSDIPVYLGYQIDRAEVTSKGQGKWRKVAIINSKRLLEEIQTYPVNVADVIDPDVKHPLLTHPLPPLILKEWGDRVSHSSMPLAVDKALADASAREQPEEVEEETKEDAGEEDLFGDSDSPRGATRREGGGGYGEMGGYGGGGGMGGYGGGMGGEMGGYGGEMGGYGGEMGGYGGEGGGGYGGEMGGYGGGGMGGMGGYGGSMGRGSGTQLETFVWDHQTPHILFRYFDNRVEPGHSYRYRVRLVMRDVNNNVQEQYLSKEVTLRRKELSKKGKAYRWTEWSEPSPVASVPMPARVYLVSAKPSRANNFNAEPKAEILIKALNSQYAAEVGLSAFFGRGSVINVVSKAKVIWANKFKEVKPPEFDFLTGITVLDFTGGEKLGKSKDMVAPARALLMDAAGGLFVQDEMEDLETITEYQAILEAGKNSRGRGGRGGGMGGYGGEGGGYGGEGGGGYGGEGGF